MKKWMFLFPLLLILFVIPVGCAESSGTDAGYQQMTGQQAAEQMQNDSGYLIVDVRTPQEYQEGHIKGAVNIPNETIGDEEPEQMPDKTQTIYVYCRSGRRSREAAQKLADLGYLQIIEMGGIGDWPGETVKGK